MARKKILLAEDDADDRMLFCEYLVERMDIVLMPVAQNGVEVIDMLDSISDGNELPDVIILDQNMPKRNGLQTFQALKENHRYHKIPVVFYSTYADPELINTCYRMGARAVASKPLTKDGYHKMMDDFLSSLEKLNNGNPF